MSHPVSVSEWAEWWLTALLSKLKWDNLGRVHRMTRISSNPNIISISRIKGSQPWHNDDDDDVGLLPVPKCPWLPSIFFYQMVTFVCLVHIHICLIYLMVSGSAFTFFVSCLGLCRLPPGIYSIFFFFLVLLLLGFQEVLWYVLLDGIFWWFFCLFWWWLVFMISLYLIVDICCHQ